MNTYYVAGTNKNYTDAKPAIAIEAKSLTSAKSKATKLAAINEDIANCDIVILGDHIDSNGYIDHVLVIKASLYFRSIPRWLDDTRWVCRD